jgi:hypothetical protein
MSLYQRSPSPSIAMGKWPTDVVPSLMWCPSINGCTSPVATVGARDTRAVATSPHNNDGPLDISCPLLLAPTIAMVLLTSGTHCYCGGTWWGMIATSLHSSDEMSNTSNPLLLAPTVATVFSTSSACCYSRGT